MELLRSYERLVAHMILFVRHTYLMKDGVGSSHTQVGGVPTEVLVNFSTALHIAGVPVIRYLVLCGNVLQNGGTVWDGYAMCTTMPLVPSTLAYTYSSIRSLVQYHTAKRPRYTRRADLAAS